MGTGRWDLPTEEQDALIAIRRDLHAHPELSWQEHRTAEEVSQALKALGLTPQRMAGTGVVADLGEGEHCVALRADMDALPIKESTDVPFISTQEGIMHACGHDAHTSCLLAVARRLLESPPPGRVRLIFQPAEELGAGADVMIEEGVLDVQGLIGIYGLHVWSQMTTGLLSVVDGAMMGSVDQFQITVEGKGGHGAEPHRTADALVAASHLVTSLQTIASRRIDPLAPVVLSIGKFNAGTAFNIIPETAVLDGTARTMDRETWALIPTLLEEVVQNTVAAFGCRAEISLRRAQKPLINHSGAAGLVRDIAIDLVDEANVTNFRTLAGEDFAAYLERVPGCFFFVGAGGGHEADQQPPHHNPYFTLDEEAFPLAVRALEACAREALARGPFDADNAQS